MTYDTKFCHRNARAAADMSGKTVYQVQSCGCPEGHCEIPTSLPPPKAVKQVGFWSRKDSKNYDHFPDALAVLEASPKLINDAHLSKANNAFRHFEFCEKLKAIQAILQSGLYAKDHRDYPYVVGYRGLSSCRICGTLNGSREFHFRGFEWPVGYIHYLEKHHMAPDPEFKSFIEGLFEQYCKPLLEA